MEKYFLFHDNLAVVTSLDEIAIEQLLKGEVTIPEDKEDQLGDPVLFRIVKDEEVSSWMVGRFAASDPLTSPMELNIAHSFYHNFPIASYLLIQESLSLQQLPELLEEINISENDWDIINPPLISFPSGIPSSIDEKVDMDIWIATTAEANEQENYVTKAKPPRAYSFNYVNSMMDFTNLPEYDN